MTDGVLDILGVEFRVVIADPGTMRDDGLYDKGSATITLSAGVPAGMRRQIMLHEMMHAVADLVGVDLGENTIQALASGLASIPQLSVLPQGRAGEPRSLRGLEDR